MTAGTEKPETALNRALSKVFIDDARIKDTNMPYSCVITDHIPYNEAGKVGSHKILNNEIKGKAYLVKAKYQGDVLEKIKLVPSAFATRQAGTFEDRANQ